MQKLLSSYLLKNRNCPLPGLGSLQIFNADSVYNMHDNTLTPPKESIALVQQQLPADDVIEFIAYKTNSSYAKAEKRLEKFVKKLRKLARNEELYFPHAGTFKGGSFKTEFFPDNFDAGFYQPVIAMPAARNTNHNVLIGDQEVVRSTEVFLEEDQEAGNPRWYLPALIILLFAALIMAWLWFSTGKLPFGNSNHIIPGTEQPTYTTSP